MVYRFPVDHGVWPVSERTMQWSALRARLCDCGVTLYDQIFFISNIFIFNGESLGYLSKFNLHARFNTTEKCSILRCGAASVTPCTIGLSNEGEEESYRGFLVLGRTGLGAPQHLSIIYRSHAWWLCESFQALCPLWSKNHCAGQ